MWSPRLTPQHGGMLPSSEEQEEGGGSRGISSAADFSFRGKTAVSVSWGELKAFLWS